MTFHFHLRVTQPRKNQIQLTSSVDARNVADALRRLAYEMESLELENSTAIEVTLNK